MPARYGEDSMGRESGSAEVDQARSVPNSCLRATSSALPPGPSDQSSGPCRRPATEQAPCWLWVDWDQLVDGIVALLRTERAEHPHDSRLAHLIHDLIESVVRSTLSQDQLLVVKRQRLDMLRLAGDLPGDERR